MKQITWSIAWAVGVVLTAIGFGSFFTVDQGERGVILRNGAFVRIADPGLGFKTPFIEDVVHMSLRTHKKVYDKLGSYSKDIQLADIRIAVNYRLDPASVRQVYEKYGTTYIDRIMTPAVQGESKITFGKFTANNAIQDRGRLSIEVATAIRDSIKNSGVIIESIQVENIDFSKEFEKSIEQRMQAEVEVSRLRQNLEREKVQADIARTQAKGRADAVVFEAQAAADAIRLRGDATAAAIKARALALAKNAELIELTKAEKWDGKLPTTMLPNSVVPFIGVK